jgi:two-component sensor histidine kinase
MRAGELISLSASPTSHNNGPDSNGFLLGGGRCAEIIAAFDWASTPLGPIESWSDALKTALSMMLNSRFPKCIIWGPHYIMFYNDAYLPMLGAKPEAMGHSLPEVWSDAWSQIRDFVEKAYRGEPTYVEDFPIETDRNGYLEHACFTFCYSPIRELDGTIGGMIDTTIETTAIVEARTQSRILNAELAHRIKNLMAMVAAVANQTLRNATDVENAQIALGHRLTAMAHAQDMLTQTHRSDAPIREVVEAALTPHGMEDGRVSISGHRYDLNERQALTLSLAINELATNAIKYGALSNETGSVAIQWEVPRPGTPAFRFQWTETGGPSVSPPERRGFGSRLIEDFVGAGFNGQAKIDFRTHGVHYEIHTDDPNPAHT